MGFFSYICPKCKKNIRINERANLRHIRHGIILGQAEGVYDGYGGVHGSSNYRYESDDKGDLNSRNEIWKSEYCFPDSEGYQAKVLDGKPVNWAQFVYDVWHRTFQDVDDRMRDQWRDLPDYVRQGKPQSGTSAYHAACFYTLSETEKSLNTVSDGDPEQGLQGPRRRYM